MRREPRIDRILSQPDNPLTIWRVELTGDLTAGSFTTAVRVDYGVDANDNDAPVWEASDAEIEVWDSSDSITAEEGDRFYVVWQPDSRKWEILTGASTASMGVGKTNVTLTKGVHTADAVSVWEGDTGSEADSGDDISGICLWDTITHSGGGVWVAWFKNQTGTGYYFMAKECGA